MMWRLMAGSLRYRRGRLALATLAVLLGASLVAALSLLSMDIPYKAGSQLRGYGANLLVLPQSTADAGSYIPETALALLEQEPVARSVAAYSPYLYVPVEHSGQPLLLVGLWPDKVRLVSPWWKVSGSWIEDRDDALNAMVGVQVAQKWNLRPGETVTLKYGQNARSFSVAGIVETGAAEDDRVFVSLMAAQEFGGQAGKVGLVQVSALGQKERPLAMLAGELERNLPETEVRIVGQIAEAEARVLGKVQLLMALVAGLVLVAAGLAIMSTMTASLLERTKEVGLMKALGAPDRRIAWFFGGEISAIALGGGLMGYLGGYFVAQIIGQRVFAAAVASRPQAFLLTLATAILVTFLGSVAPLRRAMRIEPAATLRGE